MQQQNGTSVSAVSVIIENAELGLSSRGNRSMTLKSKAMTCLGSFCPI